MFWNNKTAARIALVASVSMFATACAETELSVVNSAGDSLDRSGELGLSTAINTGAQVIPSEEMIKNLTRIFASEVPATINFEFNSAELDETSKSVLRQQARWILAHPAVRFRVFGHTDKVGSNSYNQRLGQRRADAAVNFMLSLGVPRDRLEAVASFGETRPLVLTEGRNRQNRRTVTEVSAFVKPFDGDLDGQYARNVYQLYVSRYQRVASGVVTTSETAPSAE